MWSSRNASRPDTHLAQNQTSDPSAIGRPSPPPSSATSAADRSARNVAASATPSTAPAPTESRGSGPAVAATGAIRAARNDAGKSPARVAASQSAQTEVPAIAPMLVQPVEPPLPLAQPQGDARPATPFPPDLPDVPAVAKRRLAVKGFDYSTVRNWVQYWFNNDMNIGEGIRAMLTVRMADAKNITLLERSHVDSILKAPRSAT
jgi:hypothetical protein